MSKEFVIGGIILTIMGVVFLVLTASASNTSMGWLMIIGVFSFFGGICLTVYGIFSILLHYIKTKLLGGK